jgi:hypothetical protein
MRVVQNRAGRANVETYWGSGKKQGQVFFAFMGRNSLKNHDPKK